MASRPSGPSRHNPRLSQRLEISEDLLIEAGKIMTGGIVCAVWVLGYAYVHAFHSMFGIGLHEFDYSLFEYIFRGVFFFISVSTAAWIAVILAVFTVLVLLALHSRRL